nr:hypothetical protein [Tanacetum cinerariifolium]
TKYLFLNPLKIVQGVQSVDTRLMVHTVKDVLFYEKEVLSPHKTLHPLINVAVSDVCLVELCTPETFVVQKGVLKTKYLFLNPLKMCKNTSESSDDSTNVVNAPREPFVVKQDHGVKSSQNPPQIDKYCCECGDALDGIFCQQCICALVRERLEEDLVSYFQNFQNTSESSDDSTNIFNAPRESIVVKQDYGVNPPQIDKCYCECGEALDGIYCQRCICKSCRKGAHTGYNCPPKVPIISNPEPCNQTINNELPQTLPSFDSAPFVSKPNFVDESSNIFNPPPQRHINSCEFCGSNAQYGHCCTPQAQFNNPKQGYNQDYNFSQYIHNFQQQYFCCDQCGGPHETFQCQQKQEEKRNEEEQAATARYWNILACCDDDNDYDFAITPFYPLRRPLTL